jgi:hypothetical protein
MLDSAAPASSSPTPSSRTAFLPRLSQIWKRALPPRSLLMFRRQQTSLTRLPAPSPRPLYFLADPQSLSGQTGEVLLAKMADAIGMALVERWPDPSGSLFFRKSSPGTLFSLQPSSTLEESAQNTAASPLKQPPILLVFGLQAAPWMNHPCWAGRTPRIIATHSLLDLSQTPLLKRDTWRDLKAIAAQMGQTSPTHPNPA